MQAQAVIVSPHGGDGPFQGRVDFRQRQCFVVDRAEGHEFTPRVTLLFP